jgi:hypothetical protein
MHGPTIFWANLTHFSLKAFTPVYEALAASAPNVKSYFVNIDDEDGLTNMCQSQWVNLLEYSF